MHIISSQPRRGWLINVRQSPAVRGEISRDMCITYIYVNPLFRYIFSKVAIKLVWEMYHHPYHSLQQEK